MRLGAFTGKVRIICLCEFSLCDTLSCEWEDKYIHHSVWCLSSPSEVKINKQNQQPKMKEGGKKYSGGKRKFLQLKAVVSCKKGNFMLLLMLKSPCE